MIQQILLTGTNQATLTTTQAIPFTGNYTLKIVKADFYSSNGTYGMVELASTAFYNVPGGGKIWFLSSNNATYYGDNLHIEDVLINGSISITASGIAGANLPGYGAGVTQTLVLTIDFIPA